MNSSQNLFIVSNFSERHKEQEKRMETIVRESKPVETGDDVVKASKTWEEVPKMHEYFECL